MMPAEGAVDLPRMWAISSAPALPARKRFPLSARSSRTPTAEVPRRERRPTSVPSARRRAVAKADLVALLERCRFRPCAWRAAERPAPDRSERLTGPVRRSRRDWRSDDPIVRPPLPRRGRRSVGFRRRFAVPADGRAATMPISASAASALQAVATPRPGRVEGDGRSRRAPRRARHCDRCRRRSRAGSARRARSRSQEGDSRKLFDGGPTTQPLGRRPGDVSQIGGPDTKPAVAFHDPRVAEGVRV